MRAAICFFIVVLVSFRKWALPRVLAWTISTSLIAGVAVQPALAKITIVCDDSGSMKGDKIRSLIETLKLSSVFLDGEVEIILLNRRGKTIVIRRDTDRELMVQLAQRIRADGGTNFVAPLRQINNGIGGKNDPVIWISDGLHEGPGNSSTVAALATQCKRPIYSFGVSAPQQAEDLLRKMSTSTGGAFTSVANGKQLTERVIELALMLSDYASYQSKIRTLTFRGTRKGTAILIGYGTDVQVQGMPAIQTTGYRQVAELSPRIYAVRYELPVETDLFAKANGRQGTLGKVLTNDFVSHRIQSDPNAVAGGRLDVVAVPKPGKDPNAEVPKITHELVQQGRVMDRKPAVPTPGGNQVTPLDVPPKARGPAEVVQHEELKNGSRRVTRRAVNILPPAGEGLAMPLTQRERFLGNHSGSDGQVSLGKLTIPSKDSVRIEYQVNVTPLNSSSGVIPTNVSAEVITPTKGKPAELALTAELNNVPAGDYRGAVELSTPLIGGTWTLPFRIEVSEPLHASFILNGRIQPNSIAKATLRLKNSGKTALKEVRIKVKPIQAGRGSIVFQHPKTVSIGAGKRIQVPVRIGADAAVTPAKAYQTELLLYRNNQPLSLPIVLKQQAGSPPVAIVPRAMRITGAAGNVATFTFLVKGNAQAILPDTIRSIELKDVKELAGKPVKIEAGFQPAGKPGSEITGVEFDKKGIRVKGFLVVPDRKGKFRGFVRVATAVNGTYTVIFELISK